MKSVPPPLEDVLAHYDIPLSRTYGWVSVLCPVHEEASPSARALLGDEKEYLYCHACGFSGDAWELIRVKEGLDGFAASVRRAKEMFGPGDDHFREAAVLRSNLPGRTRYLPRGCH